MIYDLRIKENQMITNYIFNINLIFCVQKEEINLKKKTKKLSNFIITIQKQFFIKRLCRIVLITLNAIYKNFCINVKLLNTKQL